ncbi:hypothetical protein ACFLYX_04100 [Chloroflexota bacterium]
MMEDTEVTKTVNTEIEKKAVMKARERATVGRWDLDIAVFLFAVLIIVIILLFQGVGIAIVAPVSIFGLAMVWLAGWRKGKQLYQRFYEEELLNLELRSKSEENLAEVVKETVEETVEEKVQKALRDRWK